MDKNSTFSYVHTLKTLSLITHLPLRVIKTVFCIEHFFNYNSIYDIINYINTLYTHWRIKNKKFEHSKKAIKHHT